MPGQASGGQLRPRTIDINFIPPAYRREPLSPRSRQMLLFSLVLLGGLVYLLSLYRAQREEVAFLQLRMSVFNKDMGNLEKAKPEFDKLQAAIKATDERLAELEHVRKSLPTVRWGMVFGAIDSAMSDRITLRSLVQEKGSVTVVGQAADFPSLVEYGARLKGALQRLGVAAQINYRQAGAPPPAPVLPVTPTPAPPRPVTPTPTPVPGVFFVLIVDVASGGGP